MKLDVAVNEAVLSNVGTTGEFRIRNSAKAFKILSDGLYSNKIRAIIRELSCNAVDSHVAAGKADIPFEVHLPTILEPWFAVKDFGLGLSGSQVMNIYTTYFESSKTESNDFIGALGLGSKSPFSYTENFTVTAIKDGMMRIYSAYINEMGVPCVAEMSEALTDEDNGVEVKFSVTDRYDYQSFRHEASNVFRWFKNKPNVVGVDSFKHENPHYKEMNIVPGVHLFADYNQSSVALMGNISYPLRDIPEPTKHFGTLASLLDCNLAIEFSIGDLDFAASREQLSYVPMTIASIKRKLEEVNANLVLHLAAKANAITDEWKRAIFLQEQSRTRIYSAAVTKYVTDTKFELFDIKGYYGTKTFKFLISDLQKRNLSMVAFRHSSGTCSRINESREYSSGNYVHSWDIPVELDVVIVLNDLKTGCGTRARYHFSNHYNKSALVYCISHTDPDPAVRQVEYDKIIAELHNPPLVLKASELEKQVRTKGTTSNQGIMTIGLKTDCQAGYTDSYTWHPHYGEIDDNETYYYVCLNNFAPMRPDETHFDIYSLKSLMDQCGLPEFSNIKIFGVRKNRIKEIKDLDNWVWIEEKVKEEAAKITDEHVVSLVAAEMLDNRYNKTYIDENVAKLVGSGSPYQKFVKDIGGITRAKGNVSQLVALCSKYGKTVQVDAVKKKITDSKEAVLKRYPMLKYLTNQDTNKHDVAEYIKLVDKQENI